MKLSNHIAYQSPLSRFLLAGSLLTLGLTVGCAEDDGAYAESGDILGTSAPRNMGPQSGEVYDEIVENEFVDTSEENTSTFSIDVDNASYTVMRRDLNAGRLPAPESVRTEEYINFFDYDYMEPHDEHPFSIHLEVAPSHFGQDKHLVQVGLKGKSLHPEDLAPTNLVFLIDVSGSMQSPEKLPLVKKSLSALLDHLRPSDRVGIVVYAAADGVALPSTPVQERSEIEAAIERLGSGGSTNAEAGIVAAYEMAEANKFEGGNNRVIILTDGDFNVGRTGESLFGLIDEYREKHISLTAVGYGLGNYNDYHMENLSNRGNGNYFYVDSEEEAERIFGTELVSTLQVIAADVKVQVEFDTEVVESYRLVGYENRVLDNEDFDDDTKDAGEIGPGHTVTAFYEVELKPEVDSELRLAEVRLRYKGQYGEESQELSRMIKRSKVHETFEAASDDFRFAAAVVEYAEILRHSKHSEGDDFAGVLEIAEDAKIHGDTKQDEFLELVKLARGLWR